MGTHVGIDDGVFDGAPVGDDVGTAEGDELGIVEGTDVG